ncbi:hypothetical protein ACVWXM_007739 [Bradyrhizobium sp. GM7.3]
MAHPKIQHMLDLAKKDLRRLRNPRSCKEARNAWVSFLEHSNRAINRLEHYAKKTGQTDKYKSLISKEIWQDDITKFIRTARNAHEHGVQDTQIDTPYDERIAFPTGQIMGSPLVIGITETGDSVVMPAAGPMEFQGSPGIRKVTLRPTVGMIPIIDPRGEEIMPPYVNIEAEDESEIAGAARIYLAWVTGRIGTFA